MRVRLLCGRSRVRSSRPAKHSFRRDLVMKTFLRPFSPFRWFKKGSCQLLTKECARSTGKLPKKRRLAKEQWIGKLTTLEMTWKVSKGRKTSTRQQHQQNDMCVQRRLRSAWASAHSNQSLLCPHEESMGPWLPFVRTAKTPIRLGGSPAPWGLCLKMRYTGPVIFFFLDFPRDVSFRTQTLHYMCTLSIATFTSKHLVIVFT